MDFTAVGQERSRRDAEGLVKPSYTAFIVHSIARALRDHPKMNRIYRSLTGYRWAQFDQIDIAVAVEVVQNASTWLTRASFATPIKSAGGDQ